MSDEQELKVTIEQAREMVALRDAAQRLEENPDFQKVILGCYLKEEPARLAGLLAEHTMQDQESQDVLFKALRSIGEFRQFMLGIREKGRVAEESIEDSEHALDDLRSMEGAH